MPRFASIGLVLLLGLSIPTAAIAALENAFSTTITSIASTATAALTL